MGLLQRRADSLACTFHDLLGASPFISESRRDRVLEARRVSTESGGELAMEFDRRLAIVTRASCSN